MSLDLNPDALNLLGEYYWEILSPWRGESSTLNTGVSPKDAVESSLSQILQAQVPLRYYLSKTACLGILRRADVRGKSLPPQLKEALEIQAGIASVDAALTETVGFDGYNGDLTGDKAATLGVNCGMSTGRNGVIGRQPTAFAANQRDEVRDLHDVAGALGAQPGMKQQTFVAEACLTPWDVQSRRIFEETGTWPALYSGEGGGHGYVKTQRPALAAGVISKGNGDCFLIPEKHTALTGGGGQAGQGYPCVMAAGFCAGAGPSAGGIGYTEELSPTLKASESGTNMVPSILCLNDQGGAQMHCTEDITGTLRAQEHGHQPLVFENHGIDARYNGPYDVAPTLSARSGTGGNNLPYVVDEPETYCIVGNVIDRKAENGGNGLGCQKDISYTLTGMDRHAVYSRQRVDVFKDDEIASTQSARQHKDATDLICQPTYQNTVGTIGYTDHKGINNQFVSEDKCIVEPQNLIRRLTPLECERLQGFPDGWTDIPGASDSARYKALGNSVAIPCVEFVLRGIAAVLVQFKPSK
ncbi:MAG: DNA cytosine methyltransferase [Proteiniphilum sp.]|nr:DNA cytosine methyltransferase [Proteiniphilum sp.]